jgi:hypothetical protein
MRTRRTLSLLAVGCAAHALSACSDGSSDTDPATPGVPVAEPQEIRSFASVQEIFDRSCNFSTCHSAVTRAGGLILDHQEASYQGLVDVEPNDPEARSLGLKRVAPGNPPDSYLIRKLRGQGPGSAMPQGSRALADATIAIIEDWIDRGAPPSEVECATADVVCDGMPLPTDEFAWAPEPALEPPPPGKGLQFYSPPRDLEPGEEWETCYAFRVDASTLPTRNLKRQLYRMHQGSHHLLVYMYFGSHPDDFAEGYYDCFAGQCTDPADCPADTDSAQFPIGGTQVAGTEYQVEYPAGLGVPLLGEETVIVANVHYTNPFLPAQRIYGESWINFEFYEVDEMKAVLDGIFAINSRDLIVEPYETKTISRVWTPRSFLTREPTDAAIFQLFGHMHKRGRLFTIDLVTDSEDTEIYRTTSWDHSPVQDYDPPYLRVSKEQGLRWSCTHTNGVAGNPAQPPKRCHEGCRVCGWDEATRTCVFTRDDSGRVYQEGEPMPLAFGPLADDDMCNMFGYFIRAADLPALGLE